MQKFSLRYLLVLLALIISCSVLEKKNPKTNVTGKINLEVAVDSVYVGLYHMKREAGNEYVGEPVRLLRQKESTFGLYVPPGRYTLAVFAFGVEKYEQDFIIIQEGEKLHFDINCPAHGFNAGADTIFVMGEYCGWTGPDWVALKKEGDVYALEEGVIKKGDSYKFWSEKNQVIYDLNQPTTELVPDYAAFNNIADGSPIVLKPTLYRSPKQKATAQIEGFETTAQFTTLRDTLHNRQDSIFQPSFMMKLFEATEQEGISEFEKLVVFFDSLQVQYPQFKHYILYQYNQWLPSIHPGRTQFQRARFKGAKDIDYERLYTSDLYIAFADEVIRILEEMDPTSPLIEYSPLSGLLGLLRTQHQYQAFLEKWKKPEDFIVKTAFKFAERSGRKQIKGEMLFELGRRYADLDMKEKARQYLQQSLKEDPRGWYAERGTAQKMLNNLDIIIGQPAPQFAAQTTSGDSIKLNDYKGKFLFIDFWGSWCGPCIGELPHLKDLASAFPTNEFQIIGLAEDDESRFLDYLKKNPLPYPNALAPEKVLEKWGITAFPTTYLIDPDGNILAKNLRGKNVIELVKGNMDKYKEKG